MINKGLLNDSSLLFGLGHRISQITQNSSASIDSHSKQVLSAIGADLKNLGFNMEGIRSNSTISSR